MPTGKYVCKNYGVQCPKAVTQDIQQFKPGEEKKCAGCGSSEKLEEVQAKSPGWIWAAVAAVVVIAGGLTWAKLHGEKKPVPVPQFAGVHQVSTPADISSCHLKLVPADQATKAYFSLKQGMLYIDQYKNSKNTEDMKNAVEEFNAVLTVDQNFLQAHGNRGAAEMTLGNRPAAEIDLNQELTLIQCLSEGSITDTQRAALNDYYTPLNGSSTDVAAKVASLQTKVKSDEIQAHINLATLFSLEEQPEKSVSELKAAVRAGFTNKDYLESDPDLAYARTSKDFHEVLALLP